MDQVTVVVDGKVTNTAIQPAVNPTEYDFGNRTAER
jgi:hypothetical protein